MTNANLDNEQGEADALADIIDSVPHPDDEDFVSTKVAPTKKKMSLAQKALLGVGGVAVVLMGSYAYTTMQAPAAIKQRPKVVASPLSVHPASEITTPTFETPKLPSSMSPAVDPLGFDTKKTEVSPSAVSASPLANKQPAPGKSSQSPSDKKVALAFDDIKPITPIAQPAKTEDPFAVKPQADIALTPIGAAPTAVVKSTVVLKPTAPQEHKVVKKSRKIKSSPKKVIVSTPPEENGYARLF
jgi:hypothetical protein